MRSRTAINSTDTARRSDAKALIGEFIWPVPGATIGSLFGKRVFTFHKGLDLLAPSGTPIYAAHDGTVVYNGQGFSGFGKLIILKEGTLYTFYAHNSVNLVDEGVRVRKGSKIAEVGSTGNAVGSHCHFETRIKERDGKVVAVDPLVFFARRKGR